MEGDQRHYLYVTDLHLSEAPPPARSTSPFWEVGFTLLERMREEAEQVLGVPPDVLVIGGDLLHSALPSSACLVAVKRFFDRILPDYREGIVLVPGNHDLRYNRIEHVHESGVSVFPISVVDCAGQVYPSDGFTLIPYGAVPEEPQPTGLVVVVHESVASHPDALRKVESWHPLRHLFPQARLILGGHIHAKDVQVYDGCIYVNPGPLVRRTVDEVTLPYRPTGVVVTVHEGLDALDWTFVEVDDVLDVVPVGSATPSVDLSTVVSSLPVTAGPIDHSRVADVLADIAERYSLDRDSQVLLLAFLQQLLEAASE